MKAFYAVSLLALAAFGLAQPNELPAPDSPERTQACCPADALGMVLREPHTVDMDVSTPFNAINGPLFNTEYGVQHATSSDATAMAAAVIDRRSQSLSLSTTGVLSVRSVFTGGVVSRSAYLCRAALSFV
ncbi:hypothetical protein BDV30DRAFT_238221 [Aspergillus minisclerotigenes]|uniref:Uncharacterized protein n=1 Tax=Aspergillus minisclerotigenes TaxID=656917 RepID=A0A5N6J888_9EURO|nr:hypothetical protein BDV30DRAFT_238221 [Aspergillus minisclerotigenes]